ncbi:MAG: GntR family transcriptional regulator, partial [Rubrimonas sp.]
MTMQPEGAPQPESSDGQGEACYRAMRSDILHARIAPKERLRIERLRETYGSSVSTLRETLSRLAGEGLVVAEGHRGFIAAPATRAEFRDLAALRTLLEEHAIARAFARGDLEWEGLVVGAHHKLSRLEAAMIAGERDRTDLWKHYDRAFHAALISASGSAALIETFLAIFDRYLRYQIVAMVFRGAAAADEHAALKDAALARDAEGATAILRHHVGGCVEQTAGAPALEDGGGARWTPRPAAVDAAATVGEKAWFRLREDILSGRLAPGRRLRLDALRAEYGFGVSTQREVLNRLATEGLVVAEGQRGFEVSPVSREGLTEVADLRLLIESHAIAASFAEGDDAWLAGVVAAYERLRASETRMEAGDAAATDDWKRCDWEFHQALIAACGSPVLMQVHGSVFDKYLRYQRVALSFRRGVAPAEHRALLDHALARDAEAARRTLAT